MNRTSSPLPAESRCGERVLSIAEEALDRKRRAPRGRKRKEARGVIRGAPGGRKRKQHMAGCAEWRSTESERSTR